MVTFQLIDRTSEVPEKNEPVLHLLIQTRNANGTDVVVRKATEADAQAYPDEFQAFLASQGVKPVAPEAPAPEAPALPPAQE